MDEAYDFGLILQRLRKERGLTQEQLANKINKESSVISKYEKNGQIPPFDTVRSLAAIFNVSMDYLFGRTDQPQGKLYEYKPRFDMNPADADKFVEMCFDPGSSVNARLKEALKAMLKEGSHEQQ